MTDNSLVERVNKYLDAIPDEFRHESPNDLIVLLDECRAALSTPTSEEVSAEVTRLVTAIHSLKVPQSIEDDYWRVIDLLQRLDRATQGWAKTATGYRDKYQSQCVGIHNLREQLDLVTRQRENDIAQIKGICLRLAEALDCGAGEGFEPGDRLRQVAEECDRVMEESK